MRVLAVLLLLATHIAACSPFWRALRARCLPNTVDVACASFFLYYDAGLLLEIVGQSAPETRLHSLLDADSAVFFAGITILALAPWLLRLGAFLYRAHLSPLPAEHLLSLRLTSPNRFYVAAILLSSVVLALSSPYLQWDLPIWLARNEIGQAYGPYVILFYLPLYLLAFHLSTQQARSPRGFMVALLLAGFSVSATLAIGQRTTVLLPALLLVFARPRPSATRLAMIGTTLGFLAALLLPTFKWQFATEAQYQEQLVVQTVHADFSRSPILESALLLSVPFGTEVLPYPFAGYVYTALFLVPRTIAPFKGHATAIYFTSRFSNEAVEDMSWGLGLGFIEELLLNGGFVLLPFGLLAYGFLFGAAESLSRRYPAVVIPCRLAAVWLAGYQAAASLLLFGVMGIVGLLLTFLFAQRGRRPPRSFSPSTRGRTGSFSHTSREIIGSGTTFR
jgi:hypothetical protein